MHAFTWIGAASCVSVLRTSELLRHTRRVHGIAMVRYRLPVRGRASVYWLVYMPRSKRAGMRLGLRPEAHDG